MKTQYSFMGNIVRLNGYITCILLLIFLLFGKDFFTMGSFEIGAFIFYFIAGVLCSLLLPDFYFNDSSVQIIYFYGLMRRSLAWEDVNFTQSELKIPRYGLVGDFYKFIILKSNLMVLRRAFIPSFIENYDEIILMLKIKKVMA